MASLVLKSYAEVEVGKQSGRCVSAGPRRELVRRGLELEEQAPVIGVVRHIVVAGPPGQGPQSLCGPAC